MLGVGSADGYPKNEIMYRWQRRAVEVADQRYWRLYQFAFVGLRNTSDLAHTHSGKLVNFKMWCVILRILECGGMWWPLMTTSHPLLFICTSGIKWRNFIAHFDPHFTPNLIFLFCSYICSDSQVSGGTWKHIVWQLQFWHVARQADQQTHPRERLMLSGEALAWTS